MTRTVPARSSFVVFVAVALALAQGGSAQDRRARSSDPFIGAFSPRVTSLGPNATRCPDPSHPLLLRFKGEAYTSLGRATLEQSHCETPDHTSFRRGEQTLTFADGQTLRGTYSGELRSTPTTATDGRVILDGVYTAEGGTGQFEQAHWTGACAGVVDTGNGSAEFTIRGS
jgi:hypothetical protein